MTDAAIDARIHSSSLVSEELFHLGEIIMSSITRLRGLTCSVALLLFPVVVNAQLPDYLRLELLGTQMRAREFEQRRQDFRLWKLEERRRVPLYNVRLNGAVVDFHKHISKDEHYLLTNCGICRKYLAEIKSCSKKLERAMK